MIVVLIIGILASIVIPRFISQRNNSHNISAQVSLKNAVIAAEAYYLQGEFYGDTAETVLPAPVMAFIRSSEPQLAVAAGLSSDTRMNQMPGNQKITIGGPVSPNNIWIGTSAQTNSPITPGKAGAMVLCATSLGNRNYCIRLRGSSLSAIFPWK